VLAEANNATNYVLAMSVLVADVNGSPAPAGTVVNLSAAGMLVELGFPLAPGTGLDFSFLLPGEDSPVAGWGQIVRRATPSRYGVRFDGLKDDAVERLRRFVTRREETA